MSDDSSSAKLSVIVTAHDEGEELGLTLRSIGEHACAGQEIVIVDDASNDGSTANLKQISGMTIIRHQERVGVARSRHRATGQTKGDVYCFIDAHQRIEGDSLNQCSRLAAEKNAIVCPDTSNLEGETRWHGAYFKMQNEKGYFSAAWKQRKPIRRISQVTSLKAPAYFIPKTIYPRVRWSEMQSGWGGSEATVSVKAFFAGIPILHLCGPLIRHKFKSKFHYEVGWDEVWRNHAIVARTCFDDSTWENYWWPRVFSGHLTPETRQELESDEMKAEREEFAKYKIRTDAEFWTDLLYKDIPPEIS